MSFAGNFRLLLIRHGETEANRKGQFSGRCDVPLSNAGLQQAAHLAGLLRAEKIDALYVSPLQRAQMTAERLELKPAMHIEAGLIEQDFGAWDGLTPDQVCGRFPDEYSRWRESAGNVPPGGGETLIDVAARVSACVASWRVAHEGGIVAAVGHAGAFQALLCRLLNVPLRNLWPFHLQVGSISEVRFIDSVPVLTKLSTH